LANNTGKKYGGRKKGVPNRLTSEMRLILKDLIHNELSSLGDYMHNLKKEERIKILVKLMPYVFPKLESVSYDLDEPCNFDPFL